MTILVLLAIAFTSSVALFTFTTFCLGAPLMLMRHPHTAIKNRAIFFIVLCVYWFVLSVMLRMVFFRFLMLLSGPIIISKSPGSST